MKRTLVINIILIISNFIIWINFISFSDNLLEIYALDIGQGDSILIKTPDYHYILIDGGPDNTVLSKLSEILPYWVKTIDLMILTHPDLDHVGGLPEVLNTFKVENVLYTAVEHNNYAYKEFERIVDKKGVTRLDLFSSKNYQVGCCTYLSLLWPRNTEDLKISDVNSTSISLELIYKNFNAFFGGDLESKYEEMIVDNDSFLDVDVLKAGHHGSNTSTSDLFIQKIRPEVVLISAGKENRFGHPTEEVIDVLNKYNVDILRTDQMGTIIISTDGESVEY